MMQAAAQATAPAIPAVSPLPPAFDAVYQAEFAFVCRSLRRLGAAPPDVSDLAQEVFLVVLRRLCDFDTSRPVRPWLFGIAYRVLVDNRRLAHHRHEVVGTAPDRTDTDPCGDGATTAEARALVIEALSALDLEQRAVLALHDIEEFTMPEITLALSIPLNTGYSRLRLARERFGREIKRLRARRGEVHG